MSTNPQPQMTPPPSRSGPTIPILFGAVIALIAAVVYLLVQIDKVKTDNAKTRDAILNEIATVRESSAVSVQTARKNLDTLRDELEAARRQASMAAGQAKVDATKHAEELARKLEAEQQRQQQQQQQQQLQVKQQITEVQQTATAATTKIGEVSTEVGTVKTDVALTKAELDRTIASLKKVNGDLDGHASLIATNAQELGALRALGERNIFEFDIKKAKQATKVGDVTIAVKRTDQKKNRFTIEVVADDKLSEKKDRTINEPIQFYVMSKARQPWEIVVNTVGKDQIKGYLSTPKVQNPR